MKNEGIYIGINNTDKPIVLIEFNRNLKKNYLTLGKIGAGMNNKK